MEYMIKNVSQASEEFSSLPLSKIACNDRLPADVFVKINEKFIKFKEQGDFIPEEKYNYFISKNVKELYVRNAFRKAFEVALEELKKENIEALVTDVGEENRAIVEQQVALKETIYEVFLDEQLSSETVDILKNQVNDFIETVKKKNPTADTFAKILSMNNTIAEHSMNVANLALLFGMAVGQNNSIVLENLYMGALFHDYGKAKIPESISANPKSVAYDRAIKGHPEAGVEMLKSISNIPKQVLTIVAEHHEQFGGVGYPKGISGDSIYRLSKIVAIANVFDNLLTANRQNKSSMYKTAIKVLEYDKGKQFDPELLPRILDVLKLSVGNLVRERETKS
ncbi:MAG: HD domain-containing protein [Bacteriovorax sp.]|nr:HD domain-containing protein [Bacteriovorax sp.]